MQDSRQQHTIQLIPLKIITPGTILLTMKQCSCMPHTLNIVARVRKNHHICRSA